MIQNIVFDMGGVLIDFDSKRYVSRAVSDPEDAELLRQELFLSEEWAHTDRGDITYPQVEAAVCKRLPPRLHEAVHQVLNGWMLDIPPIPGIEDLVQDLKKAGYRIYLLSNTCSGFHTFRKRIPALQWFDGIFASADWHLVKPEPEIYRTFFSHFGLVPGECLFIDGFPLNIEAAARQGMAGFVFHGDVKRLRIFLSEQGIL